MEAGKSRRPQAVARGRQVLPCADPIARQGRAARRCGQLPRAWCRPAFLIVAASLIVAGCTKVGPNFEQPSAPQTQEWQDEQDPKVASDTADYGRWWTTFKDPALDRLIETASRQNLTLQIAGLRILEARAALGIAVGNQYPQVQDATAAYSRNIISDNAPNLAAADRNYDDLFFGVDTAWELDFWGRFQRGIESADATFGSTLATYDDLLVSLTADVAATYILVREFEERIDLARANVAIQERTQQIAETRFRAGAVSELDVQQARVLLANTQAFIPQLQIGLRQSKNALGVLLGRPPSQVAPLLAGSRGIPVAPPEVAVGIPTELLRRRPDIRRAELDAASQSAQIGIAQADLYPRFTLAGFIGFETSGAGGLPSNNANLTDLFDTDSFTLLVGPSVRLPIFNYGRLENNVRVQDARFQELVAAYQDTVLRAYQEVEDSLYGFLRSQDRTIFLADSVAAAERAVDLALLQYREGIIDYTRVLDTQDSLVSQQDTLTDSRGDIASYLVFTYKALGGGWELRDPNQAVPEAIQEEMQARTDWGKLLPAAMLNEAPDSGVAAGQKDALFRRPDW